ncbi:unnamed protein product [Notodromas monacha]|uniref:Uncharacterized protein n=1 Tax=Notodromas monacha TaxID=399045 RepID=A0A7R9BSQ5_9CRUS|nr:unnamed protein product [Notodromas monacha]CAG0919997.1 unnamed protein product [Notodromas monacha]
MPLIIGVVMQLSQQFSGINALTVANFVVGIGVPPLKLMLGNYTFLPFSVFLGGFWIFTYRMVPETRGKTFEEIAASFRRSGRHSRSAEKYKRLSSV